MGNKFKSIALSAFVLPGLGQLYRGRKVKGGAMIMLDNLFILGGLFIALRSAGKVLAAKAGGGMGAENLLAAIQTDAPYARYVLAGFLILWAYGIIDAALDRGE
jgi:TM2 domain-containing membrane protein YozV